MLMTSAKGGKERGVEHFMNFQRVLEKPPVAVLAPPTSFFAAQVEKLSVKKSSFFCRKEKFLDKKLFDKNVACVRYPT
jgi:hypothetical protein